MATTEIEKLERRYAENPQGLTFAPLAEVHRKNGEVARALELLRAGLELHPNYIPASIVLGRCHWDLGDLPAAEAAFSHVLRLDDENVIALKSLADINERLERFSEAQRWLNRLISVDRSNEEARQQLARIETAKQRPPAAPVLPHEIAAAQNDPAEVQPPLQAEPAPEAPPVEVRPVMEEAVAGAIPPATEAQLESTDAPGLDLTAAIAESKAPVLEFIDTSAAAEPAAERDSSLAESRPTPPEEPAPVAGLISQEFVPPKDAAYPLHPELAHDFGSGDPLTADELQVETVSEVELQSSGASEFRVPNAAEDFMEAVAPAAPELPAEPDVLPLRASGPPGDWPPRAVEPAPAAEPPPARRSYSVRETKGQSVSSFFRTLLAARPPGSSTTPGVPSSDAPAAASSDQALARDTGFAEETATPQQDATVSFDDFFSAAEPPPATGNADPSKEDLDQFQTWLQNLKR